MSNPADALYQDDFTKVLEQLADPSKAAAPKPVTELVDPATGKKVVFDDPEKLQAAINAMWNAQQQAAALLKQQQQSGGEPPPGKQPAAPETKVSGSSVLSEADMKEFQRRTEIDPGDGMNYLIERLPTVKKLDDLAKQLAQRQQQFEQALTATTFLGQNRDVAQNPQAQAAIGQILQEMGVQHATPKHYEIAKNAARAQFPELFTTPEQNPGMNAPGGFRQSGVDAPPSPPRNNTPPAAIAQQEAMIEAKVNELYDTKGPAAVKEFLDRLAMSGTVQ